MAVAWIGVGCRKCSRSRARNSGSAKPSVVKVIDGTKMVAPAPAAAASCRRPKTSVLMFACPRDNGANALRLRFREGTSSGFGRNANHAFTECRLYIARTGMNASHIGSQRLPTVGVCRRWPGSMPRAIVLAVNHSRLAVLSTENSWRSA